MAAPTKKIFSVGANAIRYYLLDASGYPAPSTGGNATVYSGVSLGGFQSLSLEVTAPETVLHPGNNSILQYDLLPSNGIAGGTLTVSREDADAIAAFTGTKVQTISDFNVIGWNTSQQGTNPTVGILAYDQAKDPNGVRVYRTHVIPKCIIYPNIKGMSRDRQDLTYNLQPMVSQKFLTGLAFNGTDNGFTTAQVVTYTSAHRLTVASWVTTSTEAEYTFDTDFPKYITGSPGIAVYKNGTAMTYGATADTTHYTATTLKITFGAALTNGDVVTTIYEMADTAVDIDT